jgi:glyoxylase-like metal-dependent hydrolase (beta-lactamase superfamily II)
MMVVRSASNRRDFLTLLASGTAGLSLSRAAFGQHGGAPITATKLTEHIACLAGAGSNVLVVSGPDGVAMVDAGLPERAAELMKAVSEQAHGGPVQALFNTHWHVENTGANETLGPAGTKIIAHENTKLWMGAEVFVEWQNRTYEPRPPKALPNDTFYKSGKMTLGGEQFEYGHLPQAHTDGDIYVFLPGPNILMAGGVVAVGQYPILDYSSGGWIGGMVEATKTLLDLTNAETAIVPGEGPVQTRANLEAQHEMLSAVFDRLKKLLREGMSAKDMIAAGPTKEFDAQWGNPELLIKNAYPGLWGHVRELGGIV